MGFFYEREREGFESVQEMAAGKLERLLRMRDGLELADLFFLFPEVRGRNREYLKLLFYLGRDKGDLERAARGFRGFEYRPAL